MSLSGRAAVPAAAAASSFRKRRRSAERVIFMAGHPSSLAAARQAPSCTMRSVMKVVRIHAPGGTDALRHEDIREPKPKDGEALVRVEAIGVNFIEVYYRTGIYKAPLPLTLGTEAAGTVVEVGVGVTDVKPGDRVATVNAAGSYSQFTTVPVARLVPIP